MRGYIHNRIWQENNGKFLKESNKNAEIICVEGFDNIPFGKSLKDFWETGTYLKEHYGNLMHEAVDNGFKGLFSEVDARDTSRINMDHKGYGLDIFEIFTAYPTLPNSFFDKYFEYLKREQPHLAEILNSSSGLKKALKAQATTDMNILFKTKKNIYEGKHYSMFPYYSQKGKKSFEPTFLELGQKLFSDALAAIKLQLIGKLMAEGYLAKGPIIDYGGEGHLSSKSFFLRYPQYAMEVVLRTINELMASKVKNLPEIYNVFENPDWSEILKEITKLSFKEIKDVTTKSIGPTLKQRKIIDKPVDFLKIYNIDPKKNHVIKSRD